METGVLKNFAPEPCSIAAKHVKWLLLTHEVDCDRL